MAIDLTTVSAGDLRSLLRKHHPDCKGSFAANAPKEICIQILQGQYVRDNFETKVNPDGTVSMYNLRPGVSMQPAQVFDDASVAAMVPVAASSGNATQPILLGTPVVTAAPVTTFTPPPVLDGATATAVIVDELAEGKHEVKGKDHADKQLVEKVLALISIADPANAGRARELFEKGMAEPAPATNGHAPQPVITTANGKVKIAGVEFPIVGSTKHVPKIDPNYRFDAWSAETKVGSQKFKHDAGDVLTLLVAGERMWFGGPPGVGKTTLIQQFCARTQWPFTRVQGDKDFMKEDFLGEKTATNGNIEYIYGLLAVAMKEGHVFVCDEITYFPAAVKTVLNPVLEPGGKLVLPGNGGEVIEPHPNFRMVATDNRFGHGDDTGLFPNSQVQDAALLSRWDHTLCVTWMTVNQERDLLVKVTGIDKEIAELIAKTATDTREAADAGRLLYPLTLRHTMSWARGSKLLEDRNKAFSLSLAFASACINKVPPSDQIAIAEIAQRHFGDKLGKIAKGGKATVAAANP